MSTGHQGQHLGQENMAATDGSEGYDNIAMANTPADPSHVSIEDVPNGNSHPMPGMDVDPSMQATGSEVHSSELRTSVLDVNYPDTEDVAGKWHNNYLDANVGRELLHSAFVHLIVADSLGQVL